MKRFWLLLIFAALTVTLSAQTGSRYLKSQGFITDSIRVPTGTDTTVYVEFFCPGGWGIQIDYKDFDAADAILDIGAVPYDDDYDAADPLWFDRLDNSGLPFTLADSTISLEKDSHRFSFLGIKLTKTSVTAGLYMPYKITYEKADNR